MLRSIAPALIALLVVLLAGCIGSGDVAEPEPEPTEPAELSDFEELSGAEIPDSAESVEVFSVGEVDSFPIYVATFTLASEEGVADFCRSGNIGNYLPVPDGELKQEQHERHFIGEAELVDPRRCTSVQQGENVDRSVVFSFPGGDRVSVWAVAGKSGR
ncbi:hypothetical protein [Nocardiopsis nanhaiensis]